MEIPEDMYILSELGSGRLRWDFKVTLAGCGELVCSFYPVEMIEDFMFSFMKRDSNVWRFVKATDYATDLAQQKILTNIRDALIGLVYEIRVQTTYDLNGIVFSIDGFDLTKQIDKLRKYYSKALTRRMKFSPGPQKNRIGFLKQAYRAYGLWAKSRPYEGYLEAITKQDMADRWGGPKAYASGKGISVRGLNKQIKQYDLTWPQVVETCRSWKTQEEERNQKREGNLEH